LEELAFDLVAGERPMTEVLFSGFGIDVLRRGSRFFLRYDAGEIADKIVESEISEGVAQTRC
jgi:hypothetical protein